MAPAYRAPKTPGYLGAINWKAPIFGVTLLLLSNVFATQYLASHFDYQPALGTPLFRFPTWALYQPFHWIIWLSRYGSYQDAALRAPLMKATGIALVCGLASILTAVFLNLYNNRNLLKGTEDLHGSARWATKRDIQATGMLTSKQGVYVGGWKDESTNHLHYLKHNGPEHIMAFAPTRSGKGVSLVIPTLLAWEASALVYDIKGENWSKTAGFRAAAGQLCWKFQPIEEQPGVRFNPLAEIRITTNRDVSDAQNLAQLLCYTLKESGEDDYFVDGANALLTALILHVCYTARLKNRTANFQDLRFALTPIIKPMAPSSDDTDEQQSITKDLQEQYREHLLSCRDAVHDASCKLQWRTPEGFVTANHPTVAENIQKMLNRADREFAAVLGTANKAMNLYADPLVSKSVSTSDFHIDDLVNFEKPVSLYLVVPPSDKVRLRPLIRLIFTMIVNRLTERMEFGQGGKQKRNLHRLLFLIDEFPTLGNMQLFSDAMPYMGGYGLKAYLVSQDIEQIIEKYGDHESITSNCHITIAFAPNKQRTKDLLSEATGITTIKRASLSYSGERSKTMMSNVSQTIEHVERPLMTPDEIARLQAAKKEGEGDSERIVEPGKMLIFVAGSYPILGTQMLYFQDPELLRRSTEYHPPATYLAIHHHGGLQTPGVLGPPVPDESPRSVKPIPLVLTDSTDEPQESIKSAPPQISTLGQEDSELLSVQLPTILLESVNADAALVAIENGHPTAHVEANTSTQLEEYDL